MIASPAVHRALLLATVIARLDRGGAVWVKSDAVYHGAGLPQHREPTLQALVSAGIILTRRGPGGGYRLNRSGRPRTAGDVAGAIGPVGDLERYGPRLPWLSEREAEMRRLLNATAIEEIAAWTTRRERAA